MEIKLLLAVFASVFVADKEVSKGTVFLGASAALITTSALGVLAGGAISSYDSARTLHYVAGLGFIAIGVWTLRRAQRTRSK